jgi:hypothetical protein
MVLHEIPLFETEQGKHCEWWIRKLSVHDLSGKRLKN